MLTPAISASRTSPPCVICVNAFCTQVTSPPFLNLLPFAEEMTTGLAGPRRITVGPWPNILAATPAAAVVATNWRRLIFLFMIGGAYMLADFIASSKRLLVLTGAGCSTDSGIPDYRSPGGAWSRHKPIYFQSFVSSDEVRRFYWARSFRGWPRFAAARPNAAHRALAALESAGFAHFLITQNVDDLHQEAG